MVDCSLDDAASRHDPARGELAILTGLSASPFECWAGCLVELAKFSVYKLFNVKHLRSARAAYFFTPLIPSVIAPIALATSQGQ